MEVKGSEAQQHRREAVLEGSAERNRDLTNRNRMRGIPGWTSGQRSTKSASIKALGCKSGRCAGKAVELISGDLCRVSDTGLRGP